MQVSREQIIAYRLSRQSLLKRRPVTALSEVAALVPIRNTPPGAALLSLANRLSGVRAGVLQKALVTDKQLVEVYSLRQAPHVVPAADLPYFTLGLAVGSDDTIMEQLHILSSKLVSMQIQPRKVLIDGMMAVRRILDGRALTRGELSAELTKVFPQYSAYCDRCQSVHINEALFRLIGSTGVYCFLPRTSKVAKFARTDQWLHRPLDVIKPQAARPELLRRFLRSFGPATPQQFASWAGLALRDVAASFAELEDELAELYIGQERLFIRYDDKPHVLSPPDPSGVRLLGPFDPYLLSRDRDMVLSDPAHQKIVWPSVQVPGAVLFDGEIVGVWHALAAAPYLNVTITQFTSLRKVDQSRIREEANRLAKLKECRTARLTFE